MKKFAFSAHVTVSAYTTVIAETLEKAREIAEQRAVSLASSNWPSVIADERRESFVIEEADGAPEAIELADVEDTNSEEADTE